MVKIYGTSYYAVPLQSSEKFSLVSCSLVLDGQVGMAYEQRLTLGRFQVRPCPLTNDSTPPKLGRKQRFNHPGSSWDHGLTT